MLRLGFSGGGSCSCFWPVCFVWSECSVPSVRWFLVFLCFVFSAFCVSWGFWRFSWFGFFP